MKIKKVFLFYPPGPQYQRGEDRSQGNVDRLNANKPFNIADLDMTNPEDRKRYAEYRKERDTKPTVIKLT